MLSEYIRALLLIFIAEMGDKTQILAMMFATKYKVSKVMVGIFIGSLLNHGLAVAFGIYIGGKLPIYMLQMIAGVAFILFAIWTLSEKEEDEKEEISAKRKGGAIITVALAFFIGELGDKTQLTAITLSVDAIFPVFILLGTVSGMLATSAIGIYVGSKLGDKIPESMIKIISGTVFLIFGTQKLYTATPDQWINIWTVSAFFIAIGITLSLLISTILKAQKSGKVSAFSRAAAGLYKYAHAIETSVDETCRGTSHCGKCQGQYCAIGYIRLLSEALTSGEPIKDDQTLTHVVKFHKDKFDKNKMAHIFAMTVKYLFTHKDENFSINEIRRVTEMTLFDELLIWDESQEGYLKQVEAHDPSIAVFLRKQLLILKKQQKVKGI